MPAAESRSTAEIQQEVLGVRGFLRIMLGYVRPYRRWGLVILAGLLLEMAFLGSVPIGFKFLVDDALPSVAKPAGDKALLVWILIALTTGSVVVASAGLMRDWFYARLATYVMNDLRRAMFAHLQRLGMDYYARARVSDILSRFSGDLASVEYALHAAIPLGVLPALEVAFSTALLFWLDWRMALVAMTVWPLALAGPRFFTPRASAYSYRRKQDESTAVASVQEAVGAHAVIRAYGLERDAYRAFQARLDTLVRSSVRLTFFSSMVERSASIGILVLQVAVVGAGAWLVFRGQLEVGSLVAFQALFVAMSASLICVIQYIPTVVHASGGLQRIEELLRERPRVVEAPSATALARLSKELCFDDVAFAYSKGKPDLGPISLTIEKGQSVAFVGPSGSGKSTALSLIARFLEASAGRVTVDGVDLRTATQESWRAQMSVVFQDAFLFDTSIRENIRMGRAGATDADVEAAAKAAELDDAMAALPEKLDTRVGERGARLPPVLRQRVAIARALLRDPSVLLVDEATSTLDAASEQAINATIEHASHGRTVIAVAHRLASVTGIDRIFVLDHGRLVEQGTHAELVANAGGLYRALWDKQSGVTISQDGQTARVSAARLRAIPLFSSLDAADLEEMASLFVTERVAPNRVVFEEGDPGDKLYLIGRGSVFAYTTGAGGEERPLRVMEDGDHFGEIALLEDMPRTASIRTRNACLFLTLQREPFLRLLGRNPHLRTAFEKVARERLQSDAARRS